MQLIQIGQVTDQSACNARVKAIAQFPPDTMYAMQGACVRCMNCYATHTQCRQHKVLVYAALIVTHHICSACNTRYASTWPHIHL